MTETPTEPDREALDEFTPAAARGEVRSSEEQAVRDVLYLRWPGWDEYRYDELVDRIAGIYAARLARSVPVAAVQEAVATIRAASDPSLIPGSLTRYVSMRVVERTFAALLAAHRDGTSEGGGA